MCVFRSGRPIEVNIEVAKIQGEQKNQGSTEARRPLGYILALVGALGGGGFYVPYKIAVASIPAEQFVLSFCLLAIFFNLIPLVFSPRPFLINMPTIFGAAGFALVSNFGNYCVGKGMQFISPASVSVLSRIQVLYVMVVGVMLFKEKVPTTMWLATILAMSGIYIMGNASAFGDGISIEGILWGLGAALGFGSTHIIAKLIIHKINPVTYNLFRVTIAVMIMSLVPGNVVAAAQQSWEVWQLAFISALSGPFVSRLAQTYAVKFIPVAHVVFMSFLTPVFAGLLTFVFIGEIPSLVELLGSSIVLFSLTIPTITKLFIKRI